VLVLDAHDEGYREERAPTWDAVLVAYERARRRGLDFTAVSPCPTLDVLELGELVAPSRADERAGWAALEVVDRRGDDPRAGLYSRQLVDMVRSGGRVVCVLNRRGRIKLLACAGCGATARCERCAAAVEDTPARTLRCRQCGYERPWVCGDCGATRLKALRVGVARAREELEALAGVAVGEVTRDAGEVPAASVLVGTEAVLHRVPRADAVAFLDFDQELLAPRYRATDAAIALLARASRMVGGRARGGRVLVQTRLPDHEVVAAARRAAPMELIDAERERRRQLHLPPFAALALVSGDAAAEYVGELTGVDVAGPSDGAWLVRAPDHDALTDALIAAPRPSGRLRIEVDPLRA
jgi:primosomal protein N' (replication factor Y)